MSPTRPYGFVDYVFVLAMTTLKRVFGGVVTEEKMQASTVTELGLIRASGAVVDRQPGLLGGVHDTKKFVQAADAWCVLGFVKLIFGSREYGRLPCDLLENALRVIVSDEVSGSHKYVASKWPGLCVGSDLCTFLQSHPQGSCTLPNRQRYGALSCNVYR